MRQNCTEALVLSDGCMGDGYTRGNRKSRAPDKKNPARGMSSRPCNPEGLKSKDLIGVPWRLAFRLQETGWFLRNDIIWNKPNGMPESVRDRHMRSHEHIFMLTKSERYFFEMSGTVDDDDRKRRSVWSVNTKPFTGAHFATFPPDLILPCILNTTRAGDTVLDPFAGSGTTGEVALTHGRNFVGIELNPSYVEMAEKRVLNSAGVRSNLVCVSRT